MASDSQPAATAARPVNPLIVSLLVLIAILLAVIAGLLVTRDSDTTDPVAGGSTPGSAATDAVGGSQTPTTATPTSAPSITDPDTLELLHAEVTRDPNDPQAKGEVDAPVVMVLYSDFACPYCTVVAQDVDPTLKDLVEDGTLRVEWRDLAAVSETSPLAAQAGIAAGNQGRFWEFHDAVYAAADPNSHPEYTQESLIAFAETAGVPDIEQFTADMNDPATAQAVTDATTHAFSIGIEGTPFFIINDAVVEGYMPAEYIRATVLEQAALAQ